MGGGSASVTRTQNLSETVDFVTDFCCVCKYFFLAVFGKKLPDVI